MSINISRSTGIVAGIYIASQRGEPTQWAERVHVVPGRGIEGDRYFRLPGIGIDPLKTGTELTLIEIEAIEAMRRNGVQISPDQTRRNIATRGVSLNDLVGKKFSIGSVVFRGVRLCEPCDYLASRTVPEVKQYMAHRGGLRADVLTDGFIQINDLITPTDKD